MSEAETRDIGGESGVSASSPAEERRNYWMIVLNGAFFMLGFAFFSPSVVLPTFVHELTRSGMMVGLIVSLRNISSVWLQLLMPNLVEHRERKQPFYLLSVIIRTVGWAAMLGAIFLVNPGRPLLLLSLFILAMVLYSSGSGISNIPFMDVISKAIPVERRTMLFGVRRLAGGILGFAGGFLVRYILARKDLSFPHNYGILFAFAAVFSTMGGIAFLLVREPIHPVASKRRPFREHLRAGLDLVRGDPNYRGLLLVRVFWSLGRMSMTFFMPYALDRLSLGVETCGLFLSAATLTNVLANLFWGRFGQRRGNRAILFWAAPLLVLAPMWAMGVGALSRWGVRGNTLVAVYLVTFVLNRLAGAGIVLGNTTYLLQIAPGERRPTYLGFMSVFSSPLNFLPLLAGMLVTYLSYEGLFALSALFGLGTVIVVRRLAEPDQAGQT